MTDETRHTPPTPANGQHEWIERYNLTCCAKCGMVQRKDGTESQCKGAVKVALRETPANEDAPDLDVISRAYGWEIATDGELMGLVAGDHGYEGTGIFVPKYDLSEARIAAARNEALEEALNAFSQVFDAIPSTDAPDWADVAQAHVDINALKTKE